jgi:citrate lyase beta subunit
MRPRRALLYVPGDDLRKIQKAAALASTGERFTRCDCVCLDLEDGVAYSRKAAARQMIPEALHTLDFGGAERLVRVNSTSSGLQADDLGAILPAHPQGIILPKVESADEIVLVSQQIAAAETRWSWKAGAIALIAIVESARAILNLKEIACASPRLQAIALGAEDLATDLGAKRSPAGWEVFYARSALVLHSRAENIQAIDMVYADFKDLSGLENEARQAAGMGFSGKQVIHPGQVEAVMRLFTPSSEELEIARRMVEAYEQHLASGKGVFAMDGKMIEAPMVQAARRMLMQAEFE